MQRVRKRRATIALPDRSAPRSGPESDAELTQAKKAMQLLAKHGIMRASELKAEGIHHQTLRRLIAQEYLAPTTRGLYELTHWGYDESYSLSLVAKRAPQSVVCLTSALVFHDLTVQYAHRVEIAVGRTDHVPRIDWPPVHVLRFGPKALDIGIEAHILNGVPVNVYCPAKTVADCFRLRRYVGINVAIEGLRKSLDTGKARPTDISEFARAMGVWSVISPYIMTAITYDS